MSWWLGTEQRLPNEVKNAYDSDARHVHLKFEGVKNPGGSLIISDNGDGMSLVDLRDKWMLIGTRDKLENGLGQGATDGRLARRALGVWVLSHKLSDNIVLKTKTKSDSKWIVLDIDWSKILHRRTFVRGDCSPLHRFRAWLSRRSRDDPILKNLRDGFSRENFERLQAELNPSALLRPVFVISRLN